jgi:hypothetical protein
MTAPPTWRAGRRSRAWVASPVPARSAHPARLGRGLTSVGGRLFTQVGGAPGGNGSVRRGIGRRGLQPQRLRGSGRCGTVRGCRQSRRSWGGQCAVGLGRRAHYDRGAAVTKDSPGIVGSASERDQFGAALTAGRGRASGPQYPGVAEDRASRTRMGRRITPRAGRPVACRRPKGPPPSASWPPP